MPIKASNLVRLIRGMIIDKEDGTAPLKFTEREVVDAINVAKHDLFARRPDAFSVSALTLTEPSNIKSARISLSFLYGDTTVNFSRPMSNLSSSLSSIGSIEMDLNADDANGTVLYMGLEDNTDYTSICIEMGRLVAYVVSSAAAETVKVTVDSRFAATGWSTISLALSGGTLTLSDGRGGSGSEEYSGDLISSASTPNLGYSSIAGATRYFGGAIANFKIKDTIGDGLVSIAFNEGVGSLVLDTVTGETANVYYGPSAEVWNQDDTIDASPWAEYPLTLMATSILLAQQSKDAYYRKAADLNFNKYLGSI